MYKLYSQSVIRLSDGASIPFDPANTDYQAFYQLAKDNSLIDESGNFIEDGNYIIGPDSITLAEYKVLAKNEIDEAAGRARARYITTAPGQEMVYIVKIEQAKEVLGGQTDPSLVPFVTADASAYGITIQEAAQSIVDMQKRWFFVGAAIETIRLESKFSIDNKIKKSTVDVAKENGIARLNSI